MAGTGNYSNAKLGFKYSKTSVRKQLRLVEACCKEFDSVQISSVATKLRMGSAFVEALEQVAEK